MNSTTLNTKLSIMETVPENYWEKRLAGITR